MRLGNGWIGEPEQLLHVLATVNADRDAEGNFLIFGEPVISGITGDLVVPAAAEYAVRGKGANLAALLSSTSYGQSVRVISLKGGLLFHNERTWCVAEVESAEELSEKLIEQTWTLCTAFRLGGYLFLNDALSEDGAQEYAVVHDDGGRYRQIESITFSWCSHDKALAYVRRALAGQLVCEEFAHEVHPKLQTPEEHGRCALCA